MAVLKSTAYGQVRKSVGSNNYYRRAGVQIVRSKPTFAPSREFTRLQLLQQQRMAAVQRFYREYGLEAISQASNTSNNKRYNASSRSNRLIGNMLKNMKYWNDAIYDDAYEWLLFSIRRVTAGFSVGNLSTPYINGIYIGNHDGSEYAEVVVEMPTASLQSLLMQANKVRRAGSYFDVADIGLCGFVGGSFDMEVYQVLLPTAPIDVQYVGANILLIFRFNNLDFDLSQSGLGGNFCLYFSKDKDVESLRLLSPALFTTSSIIIDDLSKPIEI